MIPDYFLQRLIEAGSKMRERQKAYLYEKRNKMFVGKIQYFKMKEAEKQFDEVLNKLKEMMKEQLKEEG